jgi:type I restriction enzyme S subunit
MPNPWPLVSLGEVLTLERRPVKIASDKDYAEIGIYCFGRGIFHKLPRKGLEVGDKDLYLIKEGDFILQVTFAWEGAVALASRAEDGMFGSVRFPTFRVDEARCFPLYLLNYFRTKAGVQQLVSICPGSAGRNRVLSIKRIPEVHVPLPLLDEQRRIVARIEQLATKIQEADQLRTVTSEQASALLPAALSAVLKRVRVDGHLGDVLLRAPRNGWSVRCNNGEGGTPVLSLAAVTGFHYKPTAFKRTSEPTVGGAHYWLRAGDLLITRSNTPELVGHAAIYDGSPSPCIYPDLMMRLEVNPSCADAKFVHRWLMSIPVRDYIASAAKGTSPTMKKIKQGTVMRIPFPSALPLPEQRRFVAYLDGLQSKVDALKRLQAETATELDALLPCVLDMAFKGKL